MSLASLLVSLAVLHSPGQALRPISMAGRLIPVVLPGPDPQSDLPADVMSWDGWRHSASARPEARATYIAQPDWTPLLPRYEQALSQEGAPWRLRVVILVSADALWKDALGLLRVRKAYANRNDVDRTLQAVARLAAMVAVETGGRLRIVPDVSIDEAPVLEDLGSQGPPLGSGFAQGYFEPRINGGVYEAEDKVFRGPYSSAIYLHPLPTAPRHDMVWVNGTPVTGVAIHPADPLGADRALERALYQAWVSHAVARAERKGIVIQTQGETPDVGSAVRPEEWPDIADPAPVPAAKLVERLRASAERKAGEDADWSALFSRRGARTATAAVSLVRDAERGQVLSVQEVGETRSGGVALPGMPTKGGYLSFWAKSASRETTSLRIGDRWYVLGVDQPSPPDAPTRHVRSLPFEPNGRWQRFVVPLENPAPAEGAPILAIEAPPGARYSGRLRSASIEHLFDDFEVLAEPPADARGPAEAEDDEASRALAARALLPGSERARPLLLDESPLVRLNALDRLSQVMEPSVEAQLLDSLRSLDWRIVEFALKALAHQGTESAWAAIRRAVEASTPHGRAVAAMLLASRKDPKVAGALNVLYAHPNWRVREAGVRAVASLPGREPAIIALVYLIELDPQVRLTAVRALDTQLELVNRRLLWTAVNDPSDAVRAASYIRLIASPEEEYRVEGLKGVRDDSRWTKLKVVEALGQESHRSAIQLAALDRDPFVRAAALDAFARLDKVSLEDLGDSLRDPHPDVQLALVKLATKKSIALPADVARMLRESVDERVRSLARGLPGSAAG